MGRTTARFGDIELLEWACSEAEARHRGGCISPDDWIAWGEALLGLAEHQQNLYSKRLFLQDAIEKLEKGSYRNKKSPRGNWCLGHAHVGLGLASPTYCLAKEHYAMAYPYLRKAVVLDPDNDKYVKSLKALDQAERRLEEAYTCPRSTKPVSISEVIGVIAVPFILSMLQVFRKDKPSLP